MGLFRICRGFVVELREPCEAKCDQRPVLCREATMNSPGTEAEGFWRVGQHVSPTTGVYQGRVDEMVAYVKVEPETGLAENERVLGNSDEASLPDQGARDQAQINVIYFYGPGFHIQET